MTSLLKNKVKSNYRGHEHGGYVIVDSENENDAINGTIYLIDKALGRICFAHNTEPLRSKKASYVTDMSKGTGMEKIRKKVTC